MSDFHISVFSDCCDDAVTHQDNASSSSITVNSSQLSHWRVLTSDIMRRWEFIILKDLARILQLALWLQSRMSSIDDSLSNIIINNDKTCINCLWTEHRNHYLFHKFQSDFIFSDCSNFFQTQYINCWKMTMFQSLMN